MSMKEKEKKEENKNNKKDSKLIIGLVIMLVVLVIIAVLSLWMMNKKDNEDEKTLAYTELIKEVKAQNVEKIEMTVRKYYCKSKNER